MTEADTDPSRTDRSLDDAMALHRAGRLSEAAARYDEVLAASPDHPQALRLRAILARDAGDLDRSRTLLRRWSARAGPQAAVLSEIGLTEFAAGDLRAASRALGDAYRSQPDDLRIAANLGAVLHYRGHLSQAVTLFRRVIDSDPADVETQCNLAKALADLGETDEAIAVCIAARDRTGGHPATHATLGAILTEAQRYDEAMEPLIAAERAMPEHDKTLINLAIVHRHRGAARSAQEVLERTIARFPDHARATSDLAFLLMADGRAEEAIERCVAFLDRNRGERQVLAAYGFALAEAGRTDEARALFAFDDLIKVRDIVGPHGFADLADFNSALADSVCTHPSLTQGPRSKATRGGRQSGEFDFTETPALAAFEAVLTTAIRAALREYRGRGVPARTVLDDPPDAWSIRAWGTVLESEGHQTPHMHPMSWLSGVYYVQLPEEMSAKRGNAGWIEFGASPDHAALSNPPERHAIEPREGRLVLFPPFYYHRTIPVDAKTPRISIAFDVLPLRG